MLTLALDTSTSQGGVAVLRNRTVLVSRTWKREKSHSEMVTATVEQCLLDAGIDIGAIELLAVGKGPGSFTGIRIAINVAKTIAFAKNLPTMAFDTLEILAGGVSPKDLPLLTIVNAHKNLLYTATFASGPHGQWQRTLETRALSITEVDSLVKSPYLCVGDGFLELSSFFPETLKSRLVRDAQFSDFPRPDVLGRMAVESYSSAKALDWNAVQALYIRASEAEEKLRGSGTN